MQLRPPDFTPLPEVYVSAASPPWLCTPTPPPPLSPPAHWRAVTLEAWTGVGRCVGAGATRRHLGVAARQVIRRCSGARVGHELEIDTNQRLESYRVNSQWNCRRVRVEYAVLSRCAGLNCAEARAPERQLLEHGVFAQVCLAEAASQLRVESLHERPAGRRHHSGHRRDLCRSGPSRMRALRSGP